MTEDQIKHMVDRFLCWRLPTPWHPDGGISYTRPNYAPEIDATPTGTNLFDATQTEAMVRHMIDGLPLSEEVRKLRLEIGIVSRALRVAQRGRRPINP